jgi:hypothetical protein
MREFVHPDATCPTLPPPLLAAPAHAARSRSRRLLPPFICPACRALRSRGFTASTAAALHPPATATAEVCAADELRTGDLRANEPPFA